MTNLNDELNKEFQKFKEAKEKLNVVVAGGTGAGKSSLINHVFGVESTSVGHGTAETRGLNYLETKNSDIAFYDTEGYEISEGGTSNSNFTNNVLPKLIDKLDGDYTYRPHLTWYCIQVAGNRITNFDIENIELLAKKLRLPVAVVLTKCELDALDENEQPVFHLAVRKELEEKGLGELPVFDVSTEDKSSGYDLEKLLEWSALSLTDESLKASFIASQERSVELKRILAEKVIKKYSLSAAAAGGINIIPGSDAVILMPLQIKMSVEILDCFGFKQLESSILTALKSGLLTTIGKFTTSSLVKVVPGLGQFINAGVAGSLTYASGYALKELMTQAYLEFLKSGKEPDWSQALSPALLNQAIEIAKNFKK